MSQNQSTHITLLRYGERIQNLNKKIDREKKELVIRLKKIIDTHIVNKKTYREKKNLIKKYVKKLRFYNYSCASLCRAELNYKKMQISNNLLPPYIIYDSGQLSEWVEWFSNQWIDKSKIAFKRVCADKITRAIYKSYIFFIKTKFIKHVLLKGNNNLFKNKMLSLKQKSLEKKYEFYKNLPNEINSRFYSKYLAKHIRRLDKIKNLDVASEDHGCIFLKNVCKYYYNKHNAFKVLDNINLNIKYGEFVVIVGPSGSGKTTLLNIISGLDKATNGTVIIADENLSNASNTSLTNFRRRKIGYVFQQYALLPNLTVRENVEIGQFLQKDKSKWINIDELLKNLDIYEHKNKFPHELSGGQQQRVSIARSIAKSPSILFGDEPTGAVDEATAKNILDMFIKINKQYKTTVIIVTHNNEITKLATTVIRVKNGRITKNSDTI